jgi:uncharacterized protein YggE
MPAPGLLRRDTDSGTLAAMNKVVLLAYIGLPLSLFAQGGLPDKPYIYVEGKAEIEKPTDVVILRFGLLARNADQVKANQEVQAKATKILSLLDERKIAQTDVVATDLKSEPQYENEDESGRKRGKITGYSVGRSFTVKVRDVPAFPKLVDELLAIAGVEFTGIDGGLSKEKEMQDEVGAKALTNARERAEKTLQPVGMKIDSIFAISPVAFPEIQRGIFGSRAPTAEYESALPSQGYTSQYRLAPITISQSTHVIYLISPAK